MSHESELGALVEQLCKAWGPSGHEGPVRDLIRRLVEPYASEVREDALGNLIATRRADSGEQAPRIMLAAHMDEIGAIVTHIDDKGFLRFAPVGGALIQHLVGVRVVFEDGRVGTVGIEKRDDNSKAVKLEELFIDVGALRSDGLEIAVGSAASFRHTVDRVSEGRLMAPNMDDRIGCAVLVQVLTRLERSAYHVDFVFTVQEEIGLRGATTSAYGLQPDMAIAVDVTATGDTPRAKRMAVELGGGPAIKVMDRGMIAHPRVKQMLLEAARHADVPHQLEVLEAGTTDASRIQISRGGVPAGVLSIPTRYLHTPSQMVDLGDAESAIRLLKAMLEQPADGHPATSDWGVGA
jgi:endoglucanase